MSAASESAQIAATSDDVLSAHPLTQHEEVLRPDRDDQGEAEADTGEEGREHAFDA